MMAHTVFIMNYHQVCKHRNTVCAIMNYHQVCNNRNTVCAIMNYHQVCNNRNTVCAIHTPYSYVYRPGDNS
jgi:hypothetical protein